MSVGIKIGEVVPLSYLAPDGATDKFPIALVYDQNDIQVVGSPFTLSHFANGRYTNSALTANNSHRHLRAIYIVYDDSGHNFESYYERTEEIFDVLNSGGIGLPVSFDSDVPEVIELPYSGGKNYRIYATIKDADGFAKDPDGNAITVTIKSALGVALVPPQSMIREQAGVYYYTLLINSSDIERVQLFYFNFNIGGNALQYVDNSEVIRTRAAVADVLVDTASISVIALGIKSKTDQLAFDGSNILAKAVQVVDKTGYSISAGSVQAVATQVWDEPKSAHNISNTFGKYLDVEVSSRESEASAAGRYATVAKQTDLLLVKAKTDQLIFSGGNVLSQAVVVGDKSGYSLISSDINNIAAAVWNSLKSNYTLNGSFGSLLDTKISLVESEADASARFNALAKDVDVQAIKAKTNQLVFSGSAVNANALTVADKNNYNLSALDKAIIADTIWDEVLSGHLTVGTTGYYLSLTQQILTAIGMIAGTNPSDIADAVWNALRASHTVNGSFGEALQGVLSTTRAANLDFLDVAVSSRESEASASTRATADAAGHTATQSALTTAQTGITTIMNRLGIPAVTIADDIAAVAQGFPPQVAADVAQILTNTTTTLTRLGVPTTDIATELQAILDAIGDGTPDLETLINNAVASLTAEINQIPTNPALASDARFNNLDAPISSRATPTDIQNAVAGINVSMIADIEGVATTEINEEDSLTGEVE